MLQCCRLHWHGQCPALTGTRRAAGPARGPLVLGQLELERSSCTRRLRRGWTGDLETSTCFALGDPLAANNFHRCQCSGPSGAASRWNYNTAVQGARGDDPAKDTKAWFVQISTLALLRHDDESLMLMTLGTVKDDSRTRPGIGPRDGHTVHSGLLLGS